MRRTLRASELKVRPGSKESMFNNQGEANASSKKDLIKSISTLIEAAKLDNIVSDGEADQREELARRRQLVELAFADKEECAALGETMAQTLMIAANRDGFARRFLTYQEVTQGSIPMFRADQKLVTAAISVGPVQTQTQIVRDNLLYPNEFYIVARPFIEQRDLVRTNEDILGVKYSDALQATMVQEDKTWKDAADKLVGIDNPYMNMLGKFTPQAFSVMVTRLNTWGIQPLHTLLAADLWNDIESSDEWQNVLDPVSQQEILLTGRLGTIYGTNLISEWFRHKPYQVLDAGDIYVIGAPEYHGGYTDRGGIESQPVDISVERIPGRGWVMTELFSLVISNSRSLVRGKRIL